MLEITRRWRVLVAGVAAGLFGVLGFAGSTASAEPVYPLPPVPAPATVTQTVTVAPQAVLQPSAATAAVPNAAPQAVLQPGAAPASAMPNAAAAPGATPAAAAATGATPAAAAAPGLVATPVPAPPPVTITPASSGTLFDYFIEKGVRLEPQNSRDFKALNIVLPMPRGWSHVPDPNVPDAFAVIADRVGGNGLHTSNAQVVVYKLVGDFDPVEAISHGFVDSQQLPAWRSTGASLAAFGGMPSSVIEGTYRENSMTLNTSRRHVIATADPDRYLVTMSVTTGVDQVVAAADATDAIVNGFRVGLPAPAPPTAPPPPGPAGVPVQLGLPG